MRGLIWVLLSLSACGSAPPPDAAAPKAPSAAGPAAAPPSAPPKAAAPASVEAGVPQEFTDRFWVILQSDKDAAKVPASLATLAAHPELGVTAKRLESTKFKNLMPCYHVTVAAAFADKAAAVALSKQLGGLGVDNYVKAAGKYVKDTRKLDQLCATPPARGGAGEGIVDVIGSTTYLQLSLDEALLARMLASAPKAKPIGGDLGLWGRTVAVETVGAYTKGMKLDVVGPAGERGSCSITGFEAVTVGTPHFGYFDTSNNPSPAGPGCGTEAPMARLTCDKPVAPGVAWQAGKAPPSAVRGAASPALLPAARKAIEASLVWQDVLASLEGPASKSDAEATTWTVGGRSFLLTVAHVVADGGCGGVDDRVYAVHALDGGALGALVVPPARVSFGDVLGLIDADSDGTPEVMSRDFTGSVKLDGGASDFGWEHAYCDCPC